MKMEKKVNYLVVDTTAFIENAPLQNVGQHIVTCQEVVDEITSKRQLRRLVVLPYDLEIKNVYPENVQVVTDFSKKTGDYSSLSATDIKVMALTYQLEKEHSGTEYIRTEPVMQRTVNIVKKSRPLELTADVSGFYIPGKTKQSELKSADNNDEEDDGEDNKAANNDDTEKTNNSINSVSYEQLDKKLLDRFGKLNCDENDTNIQTEEVDDVLVTIQENSDEKCSSSSKENQDDDDDEDDNISDSNDEEDEEDDDDAGWITPSNVQKAKKQVNSKLTEEKSVEVACMTTDFAMQNVLKQMNLNVSALDGRMIKRLKTYILRCYACFGTTSIMTKLFCPKCGNKTLKRVAVSLDEHGKQQIHINARRPLTARGKKFSLPKIQGGKHSNNPILVGDQPMPDQRPTRLARTKTNALDDDYVAGYSPFVMRDVTSKSAQLKIRPVTEVKHWMRKNPNEVFRRKK